MTETTSSCGILLSEQTVRTASLSLTYRLTVGTEGTSPAFYLTAAADGDSQTVALGNDLLSATHFFRTVTRYMVTPCTLLDVLDDLKTAQKDEKHC